MKQSEIWLINLDPTIGSEIGKVTTEELIKVQEGINKVIGFNRVVL
jgi:hypothetical protein